MVNYSWSAPAPKETNGLGLAEWQRWISSGCLPINWEKFPLTKAKSASREFLMGKNSRDQLIINIKLAVGKHCIKMELDYPCEHGCSVYPPARPLG